MSFLNGDRAGVNEKRDLLALLASYAELLNANAANATRGTEIKRVDLTHESLATGPRHLLPIPEPANIGYGLTRVGKVSIYVVPNLEVSYRFVPKINGEVLDCVGILPANYDVVHRTIEERRVNQGVRLSKIEIAGNAYVAFTTKYKEYGHFLIETLPKLLLVRLLLDYGVRYPLVAPRDPPDWVNDFLCLIFRDHELIRISEFTDEAVISAGLVPTMLGSGPFHPLLGILIDLFIDRLIASGVVPQASKGGGEN